MQHGGELPLDGHGREAEVSSGPPSMVSSSDAETLRMGPRTLPSPSSSSTSFDPETHAEAKEWLEQLRKEMSTSTSSHLAAQAKSHDEPKRSRKKKGKRKNKSKDKSSLASEGLCQDKDTLTKGKAQDKDKISLGSEAQSKVGDKTIGS